MNIATQMLRPWFAAKARKAHSWRDRVREVQEAELLRMVHAARSTLWGREHAFRTVRSWADFDARVHDVSEYPQLRPYVMRMLGGERNVLWPGRVRHFAQSSGTSDGRSKYIPITAEGFSRCHYRGAAHSVAAYLDNVSSSSVLDGRAFILGGSFANELRPRAGVFVGDLSANLILRMNPLANAVRVPSKAVALMQDWTRKLPRLAETAMAHRHVTNISGVPSWFLTVLTKALELSGRSSIHELWPRLEVFFHGGISFAPYRSQFERITDPSRMHYLENYNSSEGFFAVQDDLSDPSLLLLLECGTFYEFIPLEDIDSDSPRILPPWEVEQGKVYALVITSVNGLWRYSLGDTVRIASTSPLKITIAGRTRHFINAFGEELMVFNADQAIARATEATGAEVLNYTAAPVYASSGHRGHHQWLIEFGREPRCGMAEFATRLDLELQRSNSDYQAKRTGSLFLDQLELVVARPGVFDRWLASTGKLGGQRKVPRLCNTRQFIDPLLDLNKQQPT